MWTMQTDSPKCEDGDFPCRARTPLEHVVNAFLQVGEQTDFLVGKDASIEDTDVKTSGTG